MKKIKISYQNEEEKQRTLQALSGLKIIKIGKEQVKKGHKNIYINAE